MTKTRNQIVTAGGRGRAHCVFSPVLLVVLLATAAALSGSAAGQSEYSPYRLALFYSDGSRAIGPAMPTWPPVGADSTMTGRRLFKIANPVRFIRDQTAGVEVAAPLIMLANGDVLNGSASGLVNVEDGPRLRVKMQGLLTSDAGTQVLVRPDQIRRIVGTAAKDLEEPFPGIVLLSNGRKFAARSVRWQEYGLTLLTEAGVVDARYADLTDAVFAGVDFTAAVLADNISAGKSSPGIIARFRLRSGAIITTSSVQREPQSEATRQAANPPKVSYHLHPVWSSHPIAIPESEIAWCSYRAADEVPLSLLPGKVLANRRLLGTAAPWRQNETAAKALLMAGGGIETDLGIATHSYSEVAFALPEGARTLSLAVALDSAVREGGCVRCRIFADQVTGQQLWDSHFLRGNERAKVTGELSVAKAKQVILVTDYAHDGRPPGADPFDIRDEVLWLRPLVRLGGSGQGQPMDTLESGLNRKVEPGRK